MNLRKMKMMLSLIVLIIFTACTTNNELKQTGVFIQCNLPDGLTEYALSGASLQIKNVSTGRTSAVTLTEGVDNSYSCQLIEGLYDFTFAATIESENQSITVKGYKEAIQILGDTITVDLNLFIEDTKADFVIAEIFFTGSITPDGKQYTGDKYFRIFNNSDTILYADGLVLMEAKFLTTAKYDYTPDIMSEAMAIQAIYRVPGSGREYPIAPGKSFLMVDNAIDHRTANENSFDLSSAEFEWYDESTNPNVTDIDNPNVTNLEKIYCYTLTIWGPHNRGFSSYAIGRIPEEVTTESYLQDYTYSYEYNLVTQAGTFPMSGECYKFPNAWILDAVNLSVESEFQWILTDPSLDQGWSYCGTINSDATRYGKSVRRKILATEADGRIVLQDTNNSTEDFLPEQTANPFFFE